MILELKKYKLLQNFKLKTLILTTRKSPLALAQAKLAVQLLKAKEPHQHYKLLPLSTTGDRQLHWQLDQAPEKGLFVKELEAALLEDRATIAVHSAKDLPTQQHPDLLIAGFLPREDPRDVLVYRNGNYPPSVIATGSPRRKAQGSLLFPEAEWRTLRGNVRTRLQKIVDGWADATFLAMAGLKRLGIDSWPGLNFQPLDPSTMTPAVGQGAIALQCKRKNQEALSKFLDADTAKAISIERELLQQWGGGCGASHGIYCDYSEGQRLFTFSEAQGHRQIALADVATSHG